MKLGFFTMPIHPLEKDWRQSLKEDREALLPTDETGVSEAYVGEHVTDRTENITICPDVVTLMTATEEGARPRRGHIRSHPTQHG